MSRERGSVTRDMTVVLTFARKRKSTTTTKSAPSKREFFTLSIELSMNLDWRKMSVETCTSGGRFFSRSCNAASSFSVSSIVPVSGCFVTVSRTAGLPFSEARPSLGWLEPTFTSATSSNVTGAPSTVFITALDISFTSSVETTPLTIYSLPYSYITPPLTLLFIFLVTAMTS